VRAFNLKLRGKLILIITAVSTIVLILSGVAISINEALSFKNTIIQHTQTTADMLGIHCTAPLLFDDERSAHDTLAALASDNDVTAGAIFSNDGSQFATYTKIGTDPKIYKYPSSIVVGHNFKKQYFELTRQIISNGKHIGFVRIYIDLNDYRIQMWRYIGITTGIFLMMIIVTIGLSFRAQRIFTKPILKITNVTEAIATGQRDFSARVPGEGRKDELGVLVRSFNAMLANIEDGNIKLQTAHDKLEERVRERTSELISEIKQRRQTESDLLQQRNMAQKYLDMAGVMLVALDKDCMITLCNLKVTEITGYSEDEIIGYNWVEKFVPPSDKTDFNDMFRDSILEKSDWAKYSENYILTKDGRKRLIAWHNTILKNEKGEIVGTLSSGIDISDKKKAEEEFNRVQKLESIGTFAGGIAHDFNNFLMVIHGSIELAQMSMKDSPEAESLLKDAIAASERARRLTQQLITFSKGGLPQKQIVKIDKLVRNIVQFVLTGSNITADINITKNLWLSEVDPGQIEQVLTNLIVNAKQAMPDGGVLHINIVNIDKDTSLKYKMEKRRFIEITIRDEGSGIDEKIIPLIFDPYFTTKREGSGLGLATSHSIIKKHDGHITIETDADSGATFHIFLPAILETIVDKNDSLDSVKLSQKYNILLMEDDLLVGPVIKIMLEALQCYATWAKDGSEAIKMYAKAMNSKEPFDAVILDIIVPAGMGGKEASRKLIELDSNANLIISSAYSDDPLMAEYNENGFKACIAKPYNYHELEQVLKSVLEPE